MIVFSKLKNIISEINSNLETRAYRIATTVGIIIFSFGVFSSYIYAGSLASERLRDMDVYQKEQADYVERHLLTKLAAYEELLISGAVLYKMNDSVTQSEWKNLYYNLRIPERSPELLGYGFVEYVAGDKLGQYLENAKQSVANDYTISPSGIRQDYAPIKYIEPLNDVNVLVLGYDMYTESNRYEAMIIARDSGEPSMTGPILAVQDQKNPESAKMKSLIMYYPIYVEDRAEMVDEPTLTGYSYIIFRVDEIMQKLSLDDEDDVHSLYLEDNAEEQANLIYSKNFNNSTSVSERSKFYQRDIDVLSRKWTLGMVVKQPGVSSLLNPNRIFATGAFISLLIGLLLFIYLLKRASDINRNHSLDLQRSKDELLALASHQLRTPATGVRQYVGMLVQGYFGKLTKDQLSIANKAYSTNERQLETIDQILYVAKADAGQLVVSFDEIDIAKIAQDIMADYHDVAASKKIDMKYKGRKKLICSGDKRYIIMIIENLLSNAIKYSYSGSKVLLEIQQIDSSVVLTVKDEGVGISEEYKDKLFQKFSRLDSPLSRSEGGTGLGLFLAQKLAESHGGTITVFSKVGKGSTFVLTLPVHRNLKKSVVYLTV